MAAIFLNFGYIEPNTSEMRYPPLPTYAAVPTLKIYRVCVEFFFLSI
jgi:hypothetical protein